MRWTGWTTFALGLWLIASPLVWGYAGLSAAVLNDGLFGAIIAGLSAWGLVTTGRASVAFTWLVVVAGLWVGLAPFALGYESWQNVYVAQSHMARTHLPYLVAYAPVGTATASDVVVGVAVVALGLTRALTSGIRIRV